MSNLVPMVVTREGNSERSMDIFSRMLKERIIYVTGSVTDEMADVVVPQLHHLEHEDPTADITMIINSPGGSVIAGLAIYDTMQFISCDVKTICIGQACSMGSFLLSGGTPGKRHSLPSSRIMIHAVAHGWSGKIQDTRIAHEETEKLQTYLNDCLARHCGKTNEQLVEDTDRDNFMSPTEAVEYGLIDSVITERNE